MARQPAQPVGLARPLRFSSRRISLVVSPAKFALEKQDPRLLAAAGTEVFEAHEETDRAYATATARLKLPPHQIFFGYAYASLEMLLAEKPRGVRTLLGQIDPGALECQLVAEEMSRFPEFAGPPPEFPAGYYDRNRREWELADRILVNSAFSRDGLIKQGVNPQKLVVVPLCFEPRTENPPTAERPACPPRSRPLKVLFLGQVILRKGIHYLLEAARQLDPDKVHFDIVGALGIKPEATAKAPRNVTLFMAGPHAIRRQTGIAGRMCSSCQPCRTALPSHSWRR